MKKLSLYIFLILIFSNFSSITKAKEIEAFCLININDLTKSNLAKEDHYRFVGKEIHFLINFDENLILDISKDSEVSIITGMYGPNDMQEFAKTKSGIIYNNQIEVKGNNEGDLIKYSYINTIQLSDGKPKRFNATVDQTGISFNKWNFKFNCRDYAYSDEEKRNSTNPFKSLKDKMTEDSRVNELLDRRKKEEEEFRKKQVPVIDDLNSYVVKNYEDLLYLYKAKIFNNKKYAFIELKNSKKITFEDVIDFNETELFKLTFKGKGHNLRKNKLKKQFLKEKEKLKN